MWYMCFYIYCVFVGNYSFRLIEIKIVVSGRPYFRVGKKKVVIFVISSDDNVEA